MDGLAIAYDLKRGELLSIYLDEKTVGEEKAKYIKSSKAMDNVVNGSLLWQVTEIINNETLMNYRDIGYQIPDDAYLYVEITLQGGELDSETKALFEGSEYSGGLRGYITLENKYIATGVTPTTLFASGLRKNMTKPNIYYMIGDHFKLDNSKCWSVGRHTGIRFPELGETPEQTEVKQIIEALNGVWEDHLHDDALNPGGSEYAWRGNMAKSFFFKDLWENGYIEGMFNGEYIEGNPVYDNIKKYVYNQGLDEGFMPENVEGVLPPTGGGRKKRRKRRKIKNKKSKKRKSKKKKSKKKKSKKK